MAHGRSKPELYFLFWIGLKPRQIQKLIPEFSLSTIYYYNHRSKEAVENLIKRDIINSDKKLKVDINKL